MSLPKAETPPPSGITTSELLNVIGFGESGNNPNSKRGDNNKAWGRWQMHKIFVDDVNLLTGSKYDHSDAEDPTIAPQLAKDAVAAFSDYLRGRGVEPTAKHIAYIWNGGRSGYKYMDPNWVERAIEQAPEVKEDKKDKRKTKAEIRKKDINLKKYWAKFQKNRANMVPTTPPAQTEQPNNEGVIQQAMEGIQNMGDIKDLQKLGFPQVNEEPQQQEKPDLISMHNGDVNAGVVLEPLD